MGALLRRIYEKKMLVMLLFFCLVVPYSTSAQQKPNIIYVMLDDAGYGDFGTFGSEDVLTPTMDEMASEGIKFTNHYSGSSVCAPTRCVLMTGLHTGHARRRDNQAKANWQQADVPKRKLVFLQQNDVTVAHALKEAGYVTAGIGKWGLGNPGSEGQPDKMGFDHWYGYLDQVHAHDHFTDHLWKDSKMIDIPENRDGQKGKYVHDLFERETMEFIRKNHKNPFFLYLAYTLPHGKYEIPKDDPSYQFYKDRPWSQQVKNYAAMITKADATVGSMMQLLKELGLDENTIVFYTSDNGPNKPFVKPLNSAGGLRGIKRSLYEGGIRAGMVVRWPGKLPKDVISDFQWGMRDIFPTLCDLAGANTPENLDGISVVPSLFGNKQAERDHLYWEYHSPFQQAVRMGDWKGIRFGAREKVELYNLALDEAESIDIAKNHQDIVRAIQHIMDTSRTDTPFWPVYKKRKTNKRN